MKIISTNLSEIKTISWKGKKVKTGIFKKPTDLPIFLGAEDVKNDAVVDRKHHGGIYKACYVFGHNHYDKWQKDYLHLDWKMGMFGENITLESLDESKVFLGDIYEVGEAIVQVTEPRQPCSKVNIVFKDDKALKRYIDDTCSGIYLRILTPGKVQNGDTFKLKTRIQQDVSILDMYQLQMNKLGDTSSINLIDQMVSFDFMSEKRIEKLIKRRDSLKSKDHE